MFTTAPQRPDRSSRHIVAIEEAIAEIRAGRMIILMDDEDRENEGDLCMAAERVTPDAINFMAKFGRGLICLPVTPDRAEQLGLAAMARENNSPLGTAFTVSIDARRGLTHGQSAADRATTILTAIRDGAGPQDLVTPGHVFPLIARRGGVLVRTGQTEGAVDLSRLAGLRPAGVICEIMRDDGTMARLSDLELFAERHRLKIATIADLIQYRLRNDSLVHCLGEARLPTRFGEFRARVYQSHVDGSEHLVLLRGEIAGDEPILVRAHAEYLPGDVFAYQSRNTGEMLHRAMMRIDREGRGVVLYLRRESMADEITSGASAGEDTRPSTASRGRLSDFRDYGIGAQILRDVGVRKIRLLTNYPRRLVSLPGYGLEIVECVPLALDASYPVPEGV
ncbi:MAG TPA: 3,4-dihydroxy-2-butanone-4-phosphate synthase [Candidatus Binatia bacterium]|nr:3,4-dihydroxy-2-butanone-4-phosphate synthase [Candidatus Binatia bacterium]